MNETMKEVLEVISAMFCMFAFYFFTALFGGA